jgi:hypothetical protein
MVTTAARSVPLSFFRLKVADDPGETGDRVRVPKVARVLVALRFALVPQAAKVVDHALESLDAGHGRTISSLATSILLRLLTPRWAGWRSGVVGLILAGEHAPG